MDTIAAKLFNTLSDKFNKEISTTSSFGSSSSLNTRLQAKTLGRNTIGPFSLNINGKTYVTNKLEFDVIDSLPQAINGAWVRVIRIDDTSAYIIIEQKTFILNYITSSADSVNSFIKTSDEENEITMPTGNTSHLTFGGSHSEINYLTDPKTGAQKPIKYFFATYKLVKADKNKPTIITRNNFINYPLTSPFKNIIIK